VRPRRAGDFELTEAGKDVRIITVGRKARDQLRRQYGKQIVESYRDWHQDAGPRPRSSRSRTDLEMYKKAARSTS